MSYYKKSIISLIGLYAISINSFANTDNISNKIITNTIQKSISYKINSTTDNTEKLNATATTSSAPLVISGFRKESANIEKRQSAINYKTANDFSIYNVSSRLINDFDYDGFYHHFSITIDADTIYSSTLVYAKLYLSYEGGPWNYYASSDAYYIYSDSAQDSFVIETELTEGYPAGYYDVRIELYDAVYNQWLISYGPYDNYAINALPLEDSYYDAKFTDTTHSVETDYIYVGSGSLNISWLLIPIVFILGRRFIAKFNYNVL